MPPPTRRGPTLRLERALLADAAGVVVGIDEVGRGALAGPLVVGAVAVTNTCRRPPQGIRDSKVLAPAVREGLVPAIRRWAAAVGIGVASAAEIDAFGLTAALRTAALRALVQLPMGSVDAVLLDGSHGFLEPGVHVVDEREVLIGEVRCRPRADDTWTSVAAASIVAKVQRDAWMADVAQRLPHYGWAVNKGYATADHAAALREHGPCVLHRLSWRLTGGHDSADGDAGGNAGLGEPTMSGSGVGEEA